MYLVGLIRALGLRGLLNAGWVAASLPIVIAFLPISQLLPFHRLLMQVARRGVKLCALPRSLVPQRNFLHFYMVGVVWTTFLLLSTYFYWKTVFVLLLLEIQVLRRLYESIHVFNYSPTARMHIFGYLVGILYDMFLPLYLLLVFSDEYVIPHGDWFEIVSCPHYLAEIVIYIGILVASRGLDITIWLLLVFVVSNLSIAAIETHKWYQ
ncbi:Polyprenol reductase 1 [Acorus gramineus]|uniref:Polyprenol reductase 1 n=1 Tax=Acorus gramineus TaxID=55184 RepID=A0AAV9BGY4_ACOGR|nr:Polyprenol reductase 1 [Acorus gramineus]